MIHKAGYKAVLTGEGGDEFFCGYPTLHAANIARYYGLLPKSVRDFFSAAVDKIPQGRGGYLQPLL